MGNERVSVVTGGAGFIGSHLVRALLNEGDQVRVIDDLSTGHLKNLEDVAGQISFHQASILNEDALGEALAGADRVFHHAAQISVPLSMEDPETNHSINVTGTLKVLQAARAAGVRRVVFASSCAMYGDDPRLPKLETHEPRPQSPYATSKLMGELYGELWTTAMGLEMVSLRYFNVFGPRQDPKSAYAAAIPAFITRVLADEAITIHGDGEQTRDFVFVDNVVEANLKASVAPDAPGRSFNVGCGEEVSVNELVETIGALTGKQPRASHGPGRAGDIRRSRADISLAQEVLGYTGAIDLREGLRRTLPWYGSTT